jgi:3-oxoadipate enol-lactonase
VIATAQDGTRLHFVSQGAGPPILLLGGKTSSIDSAWWRYLPVLSGSMRVLAMDNRGAGKSEKPDHPYTTELMAGDAVAVLDAASERSAHWLGISLGGMVAQQAALMHPQRMRSLILCATHCGGRESVLPLDDAEKKVLEHNRFQRLAHLYAPSFLRAHEDWVAEDVAHFGKMPLYAIHRQDQAVRGHMTCDRLGEISLAVLILHGRQDRLVPVERAEELHRLLANSRLRILDPAGHQVHSEQIESVRQAVLDFVRQVEAGRR